MNTADLQYILNTQPGIPLMLYADPANIAVNLAAINGLSPQATPVAITLNLSSRGLPRADGDFAAGCCVPSCGADQH